MKNERATKYKSGFWENTASMQAAHTDPKTMPLQISPNNMTPAQLAQQRMDTQSFNIKPFTKTPKPLGNPVKDAFYVGQTASTAMRNAKHKSFSKYANKRIRKAKRVANLIRKKSMTKPPSKFQQLLHHIKQLKP